MTSRLKIGDSVRCIGDSDEQGVPNYVHGKRGVVVPTDESGDPDSPCLLVDFGPPPAGEGTTRSWYVHPNDLEHVADATGANAGEVRAKADRRERIATALAQGLLANGGKDYGGGSWSGFSLAAQAVGFADALIAALDKPAAEPSKDAS